MTTTTSRPTMTPVVYLRGAGMPQAAWDRIESAMWTRGYATTHDRTSAWHLARGGAPVVLCDFSADQDATSGPWYGYDMYVTVGRVRAKYGQEPAVATVASLLPAGDCVRLMREGASWLDVTVEATTTTYELPLVKGGRSDRPCRTVDGARLVDETALVGLVAQALGQPAA